MLCTLFVLVPLELEVPLVIASCHTLILTFSVLPLPSLSLHSSFPPSPNISISSGGKKRLLWLIPPNMMKYFSIFDLTESWVVLPNSPLEQRQISPAPPHFLLTATSGLLRLPLYSQLPTRRFHLEVLSQLNPSLIHILTSKPTPSTGSPSMCDPPSTLTANHRTHSPILVLSSLPCKRLSNPLALLSFTLLSPPTPTPTITALIQGPTPFLLGDCCKSAILLPASPLPHDPSPTQPKISKMQI